MKKLLYVLSISLTLSILGAASNAQAQEVGCQTFPMWFEEPQVIGSASFMLWPGYSCSYQIVQMTYVEECFWGQMQAPLPPYNSYPVYQYNTYSVASIENFNCGY